MIAAAMPKTPQSAQYGGALKLHRDCGFGEVSNAALQPQSPANPPFPETGTVPAINYLTSGVAALSPSITGRGGVRNRADRESHALTAAQIANLKAAERHAEKIGLPAQPNDLDTLGRRWSALGGHGQSYRALYRSHGEGSGAAWQRNGMALDA